MHTHTCPGTHQNTLATCTSFSLGLVLLLAASWFTIFVWCEQKVFSSLSFQKQLQKRVNLEIGKRCFCFLLSRFSLLCFDTCVNTLFFFDYTFDKSNFRDDICSICFDTFDCKWFPWLSKSKWFWVDFELVAVVWSTNGFQQIKFLKWNSIQCKVLTKLYSAWNSYLNYSSLVSSLHFFP